MLSSGESRAKNRAFALNGWDDADGLKSAQSLTLLSLPIAPVSTSSIGRESNVNERI